MQNQRKHKRFRLRLINIESKVNMAGKADVVDLSLGGALLRTEGKLAIGKECSISFSHRGKQYPVKGLVIRSELSRLDERSGNRTVARYLVGIMFKDESAGTVIEFLDSIEQSHMVEMPATANWRFRDVQFSLTTPTEKVLDYPAQFSIQDISKSGIIIQTEQQLKMDSMILLELSLDAAAPVSFMGKVVSCRPSRHRGQAGCTVGVEFTELTERAAEFLLKFTESLKNGHT